MATFTYSAVRGSDLDRARELIGGVVVAGATESDPGSALRSDEEITTILAREGFDRGVAWLAAGLYAQYAQEPTRLSASGRSLDFSNLLDAWADLAKPLRVWAGGAGATPATASRPQPRVGTIAAGSSAVERLR